MEGYALDDTFGPDIDDGKAYIPRLNFMDLWRMENKYFPFDLSYRDRYAPR